jgi:hypothetical protein
MESLPIHDHDTGEKHSVFVYLRSGGIEEVGQISRIDLSADMMTLLNEDTAIAVYPRKDVFFCGNSEIASSLIS